MNDCRYGILEALSRASTIEEKAFYLDLLKDSREFTRIRSIGRSSIRFAVSFVNALSIFVLESFYLVGHGARSNADRVNCLFGSFRELNTTNIRFRRFLTFASRSIDVLVIDSPLKRYTERIDGLDHVKLHWCRSPISDLRAVVALIGRFGKLREADKKLLCYREYSQRALTMCLVRLLRGLSISQRLRQLSVEDIVFTLSGNACTSVIELNLKGFTQTTHWLHGVGLGFNFDSFSDYTLVNNAYDHEFYKDGLCGASIIFPDTHLVFSVPAEEDRVDTVVVYSNLIHTNNEYFKKYGFAIESDLLSLVQKRFPGRKLFVKPHPASLKLLGGKVPEYRDFLQRHGFEIRSTPIEIENDRVIYISTVSTSFIDLISQGRCVFLYDRYGSPYSTFQKYVKSNLKFKDDQSFDEVVRLLASPDKLCTALQSVCVSSECETFAYLLNKVVSGDRRYDLS